MRFFVVVGMILLLIGFANGLPIHSVSAQEIQPTVTSEPSTATEDIDSAEAEELLIPPRSVDLTTQPQAKPLPPKPTAVDPASVTEPKSEPTETSDPSGDEKASPYTDYEQDISPILPVDHAADSEFQLETDSLLAEEDCAPSKRGTRQNHRSGINGEIQQPIAIVNRALSVVVIDDDYNLVSLRPGQAPQLLKLVGTENWRKPVAFDNFNNNLYVLDPGAGDRGTIHKYQVTAAGYEIEPTPYVEQAEEVDLSNAIDFAIDGDIFVLLQDSSVLRFSAGRKVPFETNGLVGEAVQATRIFTEVNADSLYLVDPKNERIVEIDKTGESEGAFVRQFKFVGKENFFANIRSIWIDENETTLVVLGDTSVRQFVIPKKAS